MAKKIPLRQCLGCRVMKPKSVLVRVVKNADAEISLDPQGKLPGRGAYLCSEESCLKKILKSRALERALSAQISPELYSDLEESLNLLRQEVLANE